MGKGGGYFRGKYVYVWPGGFEGCMGGDGKVGYPRFGTCGNLVGEL